MSGSWGTVLRAGAVGLSSICGETYLGGAGVNRSANQIDPITTRNIPTLTHAFSLQYDTICPNHREHPFHALLG